MRTLGPASFQPDVRKQRADTLAMIAAGRLNVPMLIVWGLDDPSAPVKLGMDLLGIVGPVLPHARLHVFNRAGHYAFREHAAELNRLIAAFADEVVAR
jgi:pimeloyl-ACP methyl ester carboxylesterase